MARVGLSCAARRALLGLALAGLAVSLSACGGAASALDPVAEAATKSADAGGATVKIDMAFTIGAQKGAMTATGRFDRDEGELSFDLSKLFTGSGAPAAAGGPMRMIYRKEDGHSILYMSMPFLATMLPDGRTWVKTDLDRLAGVMGRDFGQLVGQSSQNPGDTLAMLRSVGDVEKVGTDTVDGVETTHYRATIDLAKAIEQKGVSKATVQRLRESGAPAKLPVEVWVGKDEGLPRKLEMAYDAKTQGSPVSTRMTMSFSEWGSDVSVDAPPDDEVFDATELAAKSGKS
jgi:hypothetical protein